MKVVTFNVNSIRQRFHQLAKLIDDHSPDIIGLQETKVTDEDFPIDVIKELGYEVAFHGQKTHYGVATMSKKPMEVVAKQFEEEAEDHQRRLLITKHDYQGQPLYVVNGYFPQGENRKHETKFPAKRAFYANLLNKLKNDHTPEDQVIVLGDFNISVLDTDIGIGDNNRKRWLRDGKTSFLPEEREWMQSLMDWGLQDTYRVLHGPDHQEEYSWFDYRSRGFNAEPKRGLRIDSIYATPKLAAKSLKSFVDYDIRAMEKPSDHAPVLTEFEANS